MTYLDGNSDRIAQWEDLQPEEMPTAARAMLEAGKYLTKVNGLWHKLEPQDLTQMKLVLIAEAKREQVEKLTLTKVDICGSQNANVSQGFQTGENLISKKNKEQHPNLSEAPNDQKPPRLTKLEKRRLKREEWLEFWLPNLQFIRNYVHQRDRYGWTRPRTCSEISKWTGLAPYKVSRIAQKAIQLGFIAKEGRCYVPKIGRPPVL